MTENASTQNLNLENWMRDLPRELKDLPIVYLAIPGSHDSMTYSITRSSTLAPDADMPLRRLYPLFKDTMLRWTKTQEIDAFQQMLIGIRYFDLRVATKTGSLDFFFTHGLYASEISGPLDQIKEFLDTHPDEVVILDFQHLYSFTQRDHERLMAGVRRAFGPRLAPRQLEPAAVTLASMRRLGQQVIVVYRNQQVYSSGEFWPGAAFPSPWPQRNTPAGLRGYLEQLRRQPGVGFVHQAVLTPTPVFIVLRWISSLKEKCALPVIKEVLPMLATLLPGPPSHPVQLGYPGQPGQPGHPGQPGRAPVNVAIADFVNLNDSIFSNTIVQLNYNYITRVPLQT